MATKRDPGDGTVFWDKAKDAFTIRVRVGGGKKLTGTAATKAEALVKLRELRARAATVAEGANEPDSQSLATYLRFWLATRRQGGLRIKTDEFYTRGVERLLIPYLGDVPLAELNAMHVLAAYQKMDAAGLGKASQGAAHATLSSALSYAVQPLRLVPYNVTAGVKKPAAPRRAYVTWSPKQMAAFEAAARGDWYEALYVMAIRTGAREGELLALHWDSVDLKAGTARIEYTLTETRGTVRGRFETKTKKSRRALHLDATCIAALRRHRAALLEAGLAASPLVFPTRTGSYPLKYNLLRGFKLLSAKAGVPEMRFHDIRHSYASYLMSTGVNPVAVAESLGQSGTATLMSTYTHVSLEQQRRISDAFSDAIARGAAGVDAT